MGKLSDIPQDDLGLTRLIITNDDIKRYFDKVPELKNIRLKESMIVDIYR